MTGSCVYQSDLFNDCATNCEAYGACGGYRNTAPCGCIYPLSSEMRYKCNNCYIICRERGQDKRNPVAQTSDFSDQFSSGLSLDQLSLKQGVYDFPPLIPSYTDKYRGKKIFSDFVAVDIRMLFNCRHRSAADIKPLFSTEKALRKHLNVSEDCQLIAVLNGEDWRLESIWAMRRTEMLGKLFSLGFTFCTGPTFSLTSLTTFGSKAPYSHHTVMLMRHHRVMAEIDNAGLCGIPNLYWIEDDQREINRWTDWLKTNSQINIISKDFTSTRYWSSIKPRLIDLVEMFKIVGRSFHVLIIGTGAANANKVYKFLKKAGHKVSIVTSAPILKALHGGQYYINQDGKLCSSFSDRSKLSISDLIEINMELFKRDLNDESGCV